MEDHVALKLTAPRVASTLLLGTATIALLLTVVGIFGSVRYNASRRSYEMAIRLSLGATPESVTRLMVTSALRAILIGGSIGLLVSLGGTALIRGLLFGIGPIDPTSFGIAATLLLGAAGLAAYLPARAAGRTDLSKVLKES